MKVLTCLLLVCFQVFVISGHEGGYGNANYYKRCGQMFHSLNKDALFRIDSLISRYGKRAYKALVYAYREVSPRINAMSSAQLETFLCNKVKAAVPSPAVLSYAKARRSEECEALGGERAQIFDAAEQQLAQTAAKGNQVLLGLYYHRGVFKWLGHQPMNYSNWAYGEPSKNSRYTDISCPLMKSDGKWKVGNCRLKDVLCEKRPIVCGPPATQTTRPPQPMYTTKIPKPAAPTEGAYPSSGDLSALKDATAETKTLEMSMDIDYNLVKSSPSAFSSSLFKTIRAIISPKLITVKKMRSGSTIVTFTLTAPKESDSLTVMIKHLKNAYEKGQFTVTFMNREVRPTPGFKLRPVEDEEDEKDHHRDGLPYIYRILIYIFIIFGILVGFALVIVMLKAMQKQRGRTKPEEGKSPPIFWVNGVATSDVQLGPPPEKDAPPAYSEACQKKV